MLGPFPSKKKQCFCWASIGWSAPPVSRSRGWLGKPPRRDLAFCHRSIDPNICIIVFFSSLLIGWLIEWFIDWLIDWFIDWFIDSLIDSLIHWFIDSLIHWLVGCLLACLVGCLKTCIVLFYMCIYIYILVIQYYTVCIYTYIYIYIYIYAEQLLCLKMSHQKKNSLFCRETLIKVGSQSECFQTGWELNTSRQELVRQPAPVFQVLLQLFFWILWTWGL